MRLSDLRIKPSYTKTADDIANDFYLPCMRTSISYDRISGYFGSTVYIIAWSALKDFMDNGGKMRLICSPYLSEEDQEAITSGYSAKTDAILANYLRKEIEEMLAQPYLKAPATLLAYMISEGIVDIKIAAIDTGRIAADIRRLFHDKVGIFTDEDGNAVGFRGSMNETFKGLSSDGNIESIDAFPNWMEERDGQRLTDARVLFNKLWSNEIPNIAVYHFPEVTLKKLREMSNGCNVKELLSEIEIVQSKEERWASDKHSGSKRPRKHQIEALEAWEKNGRRGIFEHATGSGKTYTAICAIRDALEKNETVLILVPSIALLTQWKREIDANLKGIDVDFLLCGDEYVEWKGNAVLSSWTAKSTAHHIIIATMDTASSIRFISSVSQGEHLFLVADEMHRLGSPKRRNVLSINAGARLGLSATPRRYGDEEGTNALFEYFGGIIYPPYTLMDAINSGVLTRYFYYPQRLSLTPVEQDEWNDISTQISRIVARTSKGTASKDSVFQSPALKRLLIKRARIVKNASGKVELALRIVQQHYHDGQKWIVYCDNIDQLKMVLKSLSRYGYDAYEYYAEMEGDREETLAYFADNGGILVSIKCLDEGVDIPSTTHALILASSQNSREFIQRRGRILRKAKEKHFAYLYDVITVPFIDGDESQKSLSIIAGELSRAIEFGEGADNPACIADLKNIALDYHIDYKKVKEGGYEDDDE